MHRSAKLAHLQAEIDRVAAPLASEEAGAAGVTTGFAAPDAYLSGGLVRGGLHEMVAARHADMGTTFGFAAHLARRFVDADKAAGQGAGQAAGQYVLCGQAAGDIATFGLPYARGFGAQAPAPTRFLWLANVALPDLMWALEEALACPDIGCVLGLSLTAAPDFRMSRRLALRAAAVGRPVLMVLGAAAAQAGLGSAASTRWSVAARPSNAWQLTLMRQRLADNQAPPPAAGWRVYPQHPDIVLPQPSVPQHIPPQDFQAPLAQRSPPRAKRARA